MFSLATIFNLIAAVLSCCCHLFHPAPILSVLLLSTCAKCCFQCPPPFWTFAISVARVLLSFPMLKAKRWVKNLVTYDSVAENYPKYQFSWGMAEIGEKVALEWEADCLLPIKINASAKFLEIELLHDIPPCPVLMVLEAKSGETGQHSIVSIF